MNELHSRLAKLNLNALPSESQHPQIPCIFLARRMETMLALKSSRRASTMILPSASLMHVVNAGVEARPFSHHS